MLLLLQSPYMAEYKSEKSFNTRLGLRTRKRLPDISVQ